ncbi:hypothetical protein RB595_002452 [Gaeumannomyces hyphopodioides]
MAAESQAHPSGGVDGRPLGAALGGQIKALTFDVFGTVVDWRTSIEAALDRALAAKAASPAFATLPPALQARARELLATGGGTGTGDMTSPRQPPPPPSPTTWPAGLAAQWRASYGAFTRGFEPGVTTWRDVDAHHRDSLAALLEGWGLAGLFTEAEADALAGAWHALAPWPDAAAGIRELRRRPGGLVAATLSNGNRSLLRDLDAAGGLGFDRILSSEDFGAYKPHPSTYLGAAEALGLRPGQVAMVAAHLKDLEGARACGLRTVYVERLGEEEWGEDDERYKDAREWVDIWIPLDSGGFLELARRLGDATAT